MSEENHGNMVQACDLPSEDDSNEEENEYDANLKMNKLKSFVKNKSE